MYRFGDSIYEALVDAYPEHHFLPWKFASVPRAFWADPKNQREFLDWVGVQLGLKSLEDWYSVSLEQLVEYRASRVAVLFGDSLSATLRAVYSDHKWLEWLFESKTGKTEFFSSLENQRAYVKWLQEMLDIRTLESWYQVDLVSIYSRRLKGARAHSLRSPRRFRFRFCFCFLTFPFS